MDIKELYTAINTKRRNAGLPMFTKEDYVVVISTMQLEGKMHTNETKVTSQGIFVRK